MNKRTYKILIGVPTLLITIFPFLWILIVFFPIFLAIPAAATDTDPSPIFMAPFFLIFPLMMCLMILMFGMIIFYIVHIIKNEKGSEVIRILAAIGLHFMPFLAMPAYYLIYILPDEAPEWALEKA